MTLTKSKAESGDAVNLGSLGDVNNFIILMDEDYQPGNDEIQPDKVAQKITDGTNALESLNSKSQAMTQTINDLAGGLKPVNALMTRVSSAAKASKASPEFKEHVIAQIKKIKGIRIKPKIKQDANTPPEKLIKYISASQTGIDNKLNNIQKLYEMLLGEPLYLPNEIELKGEAIKGLYTDLKVKRDKRSLAHSAAVLARKAVDTIFYGVPGGIYEMSGLIKNYIKSVYGGDSEQFHQVVKMQFRNKKIKQ